MYLYKSMYIVVVVAVAVAVAVVVVVVVPLFRCCSSSCPLQPRASSLRSCQVKMSGETNFRSQDLKDS